MPSIQTDINAPGVLSYKDHRQAKTGTDDFNF